MDEIEDGQSLWHQLWNVDEEANLLSKAEMSRGSEKLFAAQPMRREVEAKTDARRRNHPAILLSPHPITG